MSGLALEDQGAGGIGAHPGMRGFMCISNLQRWIRVGTASMAFTRTYSGYLEEGRCGGSLGVGQTGRVSGRIVDMQHSLVVSYVPRIFDDFFARDAGSGGDLWWCGSVWAALCGLRAAGCLRLLSDSM